MESRMVRETEHDVGRSAEATGLSRALLGSMLQDVVLDQGASAKNRRVVIAVYKALVAALDDRPRQSTVCLSDLEQLNDRQFEGVLQGLRYVRARRHQDSP